MPAYLAALPAAAAVLFRGAPRGSLPKKALAALARLLALLVSAAAHYPQVLKLPPRLDPTARLRGWEPLAQKVHSLLPPEPRFILAERYQVASLLAFYMPGQPRTYCLDLGRRMNQYDLWSTYHGLRNYNAVFVKIGPPVMPRALREAFQSCQEPHTLVLKEGPHVLRQYAIFVCRGFRGMKKAKFRSF
jgi:undecaprenyl-diphosphatase